VFLRTATTPAAFQVDLVWVSLRTRFATRLAIVHDGQRPADVSCLEETSIIARIKAIGEITHHTTFSWTAHQLSQLSSLAAKNKNEQNARRILTCQLTKFEEVAADHQGPEN
jgi:hypothetical protein